MLQLSSKVQTRTLLTVLLLSFALVLGGCPAHAPKPNARIGGCGKLCQAADECAKIIAESSTEAEFIAKLETASQLVKDNCTWPGN